VYFRVVVIETQTRDLRKGGSFFLFFFLLGSRGWKVSCHILGGQGGVGH